MYARCRVSECGQMSLPQSAEAVAAEHDKRYVHEARPEKAWRRDWPTSISACISDGPCRSMRLAVRGRSWLGKIGESDPVSCVEAIVR